MRLVFGNRNRNQFSLQERDMNAMASQFTGNMIVVSKICLCVKQQGTQHSSALLAICEQNPPGW